jgi:hypothetical protein
VEEHAERIILRVAIFATGALLRSGWDIAMMLGRVELTMNHVWQIQELLHTKKIPITRAPDVRVEAYDVERLILRGAA